MLKNYTILKLWAGVVLLLFIFSVTPKKILHDLVADHKDVRSQINYSTNQQCRAIGFNCDCDDLVVELPFIYQSNIIQLIISTYHSSFSHYKIYAICYAKHFDVEFRGPPLV